MAPCHAALRPADPAAGSAGAQNRRLAPRADRGSCWVEAELVNQLRERHALARGYPFERILRILVGPRPRENELLGQRLQRRLHDAPFPVCRSRYGGVLEAYA